MTSSKNSLFLMGITIISGVPVLITSTISKSEVASIIGMTGTSLILVVGFGLAFLIKK